MKQTPKVGQPTGGVLSFRQLLFLESFLMQNIHYEGFVSTYILWANAQIIFYMIVKCTNTACFVVYKYYS